MGFNKLSIADDKFDLNLKFYYWLKHLVKTSLTETQANNLLLQLLLDKKLSAQLSVLDGYSQSIKSKSKSEIFYKLIANIATQTDMDIFIFSLKLYMIKDLLLAEAKLKNILDAEAMSDMDPLSLAYDEKSLYRPYATRVNGALLSLVFFEKLEIGKMNFLSEDAQDYMMRLSNDAIRLKALGIEPNQIFMLMFSESINQSIISDSGSDYEQRIFSVLTSIGIAAETIEKTHDEGDRSTEFDLFFELDGRTYGIGAKRTLRERYKQFIKTALGSDIGVMIEITLGLDLTEAKAKIILGHGTKIFVANEIYMQREFLQKLDGIYSVKNLTLETLKKL